MVLTYEQQQRVEQNMGLVGKVLKDKVHGGAALGYYSYEDLYQIGCIGLCKAAATDKGLACFSTYAYRLIWNEICDALIRGTRIMQQEATYELPIDSLQSTEGGIPSADSLAISDSLKAALQDAPSGIRKGASVIQLMAQGYSSENAAAMLHIPANSARALASRARRYLRSDTRLEALREATIG